MKNTNKNYLLTAAISAALLNSTSVLAAETDSVVIGTDHPQTISVSAPASTFEQASGTVSNTAWTITSNNAVGLNFTGTSPSATVAGAQDYPQFYKREVDADGNLLTGEYDHLTTLFGAVLSGVQSIANQTTESGGTPTTAELTWEGGTTPTGEPNELVAALDAAVDGVDGPDKKFGSVMPRDSDGTFTITLTSKGTGDVATTQSGDYKISVTLTVTGEEKGDVDASEGTGD